MTHDTVDRKVVAEAFRRLGVEPGDKIGMHSDMPSLGSAIRNLKRQGREAMRQGVHQVIDGVLDAAGPEGLLMVPTFTYCFVGREESGPWHIEACKSQTGLLTEELRLRPDAVRSNHPTHSVAAIGKDAAAITADHDKRAPLGADSPFHRLADQDGWICYLGTNGKTLSLLHVAEVVSGAPYADVFPYEHLGWESKARVLREDGSVGVVEIPQCPGCSKSFGRFDVEAEKEGLFREGRVYESRARLFRAKDAIALAADRIRREPGFFLCERGTCPVCDTRRAAI